MDPKEECFDWQWDEKRGIWKRLGFQCSPEFLLENNAKIRETIQTAMHQAVDDCAGDPTKTSEILAKYFQAIACINATEVGQRMNPDD